MISISLQDKLIIEKCKRVELIDCRYQPMARTVSERRLRKLQNKRRANIEKKGQQKNIPVF